MLSHTPRRKCPCTSIGVKGCHTSAVPAVSDCSVLTLGAKKHYINNSACLVNSKHDLQQTENSNGTVPCAAESKPGSMQQARAAKQVTEHRVYSRDAEAASASFYMQSCKIFPEMAVVSQQWSEQCCWVGDEILRCAYAADRATIPPRILRGSRSWDAHQNRHPMPSPAQIHVGGRLISFRKSAAGTHRKGIGRAKKHGLGLQEELAGQLGSRWGWQ